MLIDLDKYFKNSRTESILEEILGELRVIKRRTIKLLMEEHLMSQSMDKLIAAVAADTAADESAAIALQGLATMIADLKNQLANLSPEDSAKIDELATQVQANADKIAAAVVANTPSA